MKNLNFISYPVASIRGTITIPGDKSISHRSIIFGALAEGTTVIDGFLDGEDCLATIKAFRAMGVAIEGPEGQQVRIHGVGMHGLTPPKKSIDCGNSGTTMRLMAGLLSAQPFNSTLTGDSSLLKRPMARVATPLALMGAALETVDGKPPISIQGGKTLTAIDYLMPEASAQVKSCLMLAALYAQGTTRITETGVSRNHTELMLKTFGYPIAYRDHTIEISGGKGLHAAHIHIPGDISSAAFFIVAATIIPNSELTIKNVGINPTRTGVLQILNEMGASITILNERNCGEERVADLNVRHAPLRGIDIPASLVPLAIDEFPVLFIAAACAQGTTTLRGAHELRLKESDRIGAMVDGLTRIGIHAKGFEDGIEIHGGMMRGGVVDSQGDHRIAMSFAVAGAVAEHPITIQNCANVATSFPGFTTTANSVAFHIEDETEDA